MDKLDKIRSWARNLEEPILCFVEGTQPEVIKLAKAILEEQIAEVVLLGDELEIFDQCKKSLEFGADFVATRGCGLGNSFAGTPYGTSCSGLRLVPLALMNCLRKSDKGIPDLKASSPKPNKAKSNKAGSSGQICLASAPNHSTAFQFGLALAGRSPNAIAVVVE